jgi:hypothetical protein
MMMLPAIFLLLATTMASAQMASGHFGIWPAVLDGGGGERGSTHFKARDAMGEAVSDSILQSANFQLSAGFMPGTIIGGKCQGGTIGDANGDQNVNVLDMLTIANHILNVQPLQGDAVCRADCNGDQTVNVLDMISIANVILHIIPKCPAGGGCKLIITPQTLELVESLQSYLSPEHFEMLMAMVKQVQVPDAYGLSQNYPNPFNPTTSINFQIPMTKFQVHTTLKIYNILGQEVATLVEEAKEPGFYTETWDASEMASGIYFYRLTAGGTSRESREEFTATKRMVLLK